VITSAANPNVKRLRSLRDSPRERRDERNVFLEGVRLVAHALASGAELRFAIYAVEPLQATPEGQALLNELVGRPEVFEASPAVLASAADTQHPQGVVAACAWPELEPRSGLRLVLDGIQDPGNLGTLLRSAEAAGVGLLLCTRGSADLYNPKVLRGAMGAHFNLPVRADLTWEEIGVELGMCPVVYAADSEAGMPYYAADWKQPVALIVGSEVHGVSDEGFGYATHRIAIPMLGRAESLNAAVAGSVILFESLRQRTRGRT